MESLALIGTVTLFHLLAVVSPGPDFIVAIRNSLTYSRQTGIWTAVGFAAGIAVHIFYCVIGLAFVISQSILLFTVLKLFGAAYLIYIGIKSLLAKSADLAVSAATARQDISPLAAIKIGFLTNVLNPKATLFFLSLFTLVISPDTSATILLTISAIMILNTAIWFSLVAVFFTQSKIRVWFNAFQTTFNRMFGSLLIGLGIKIALIHR